MSATRSSRLVSSGVAELAGALSGWVYTLAPLASLAN